MGGGKATEAARHEIRFEEGRSKFVARCSLIKASARFSFRLYRLNGRLWQPFGLDFGYVPPALYHTLAKFNRMDGVHSVTGQHEHAQGWLVSAFEGNLRIGLATAQVKKALRINELVARRIVERQRAAIPAVAQDSFFAPRNAALRVLAGANEHMRLQAEAVLAWLHGPKEARLHYDMTGRNIDRKLLDLT